MTCGDVCPEQAIRFRPRAGGPFLPVIDDEVCTLCGECIEGCPSNALAVVGKCPEATGG
jgi:ferredoxin-type protein NapF